MNRNNLIIIILAFTNVAIHLLVYDNLDYMRDELLYFSMGNHLAFGYASNPPMIGFLAFLLQSFLGYSLFAVRVLPAILSGVLVWLVSLMAKDLGGNLNARILSAVAVLIAPFCLRTFLMYQPVYLDLIFWTLTFYIVIQYVKTINPNYLIWFGVIAGFSVLNKYLIIVLFSLILLVLPFTKYRDVFRKKQFYTGLVLGFLIVLPYLIWQIVNHFPSISHLKELNDRQLVHVDRIAFLFDQLMSPFLASLIILPGLVSLLFIKRLKEYQFLGIVILLVVACLCILRAKSYYTQGIFPVLMAAGAVWYEKNMKRQIFRSLFVILIIVFTIPILPIAIPIYKTVGLVNYFKGLETKYGLDLGRRFEDGSIHSLPQDYADMIGWEELTELTYKAWQKINDKDKAFIYCENYGQAGAISIIGKKYDLPEPACFSDAFRKWVPLSFKKEVEEFIYVNDELGKDIESLFMSIEKVGSISNPHAREFGTSVYLCKQPKKSFNELWHNRLVELKIIQIKN